MMLEKWGDGQPIEEENIVQTKIPVPEEIIDEYHSFFCGSRNLKNFNFLFNLDLYGSSPIWKTTKERMENTAAKFEKPVGIKTIDHYFPKKAIKPGINQNPKNEFKEPIKNACTIDFSEESCNDSVNLKNSFIKKCMSPKKRISTDSEVKNDVLSQELSTRYNRKESFRSPFSSPITSPTAINQNIDDIEMDVDVIPCTQREEQLKPKFNNSNYLSSGSVKNSGYSSFSDKDSDENSKGVRKKKKSNGSKSPNTSSSAIEKKRKRNSSSSSPALPSKKNKLKQSKTSNSNNSSPKQFVNNSEAANDISFFDQDRYSQDGSNNSLQPSKMSKQMKSNLKLSAKSNRSASSSNESKIKESSSDSEVRIKAKADSQRSTGRKEIAQTSLKSSKSKDKLISKGNSSSNLSKNDVHQNEKVSDLRMCKSPLKNSNVSMDSESDDKSNHFSDVNITSQANSTKTMTTDDSDSSVSYNEDMLKSSKSPSTSKGNATPSYFSCSSDSDERQLKDILNESSSFSFKTTSMSRSSNTSSSDSDDDRPLSSFMNKNHSANPNSKGEKNSSKNTSPDESDKKLINNSSKNENTSDDDTVDSDKDIFKNRMDDSPYREPVNKGSNENSDPLNKKSSDKSKSMKNTSLFAMLMKKEKKKKDSPRYKSDTSSEDGENEFSFKNKNAVKIVNLNVNNRNSLSCTSFVSSNKEPDKASEMKNNILKQSNKSSSEDSDNESSASEEEQQNRKKKSNFNKTIDNLEDNKYQNDKSVIFNPSASSSFVSSPHYPSKKDNPLKQHKIEKVKHTQRDNEDESNDFNLERPKSIINKYEKQLNDVRLPKNVLNEDKKHKHVVSESSEEDIALSERIYDNKKKRTQMKVDNEEFDSSINEYKESNVIGKLIQEKQEQNQNLVAVKAVEKLIVPGSICLEDIGSDDEIFTLQCPKELNMESLVGRKLSLTDESILEGKTKRGQVISLETFAQRIPSSINLLLPSKQASSFKLGGYKVCGSIIVSERCELPEIDTGAFSSTCAEELCDDDVRSPAVSTPLPSGLKIRHPLHGVDFKNAATPNLDAVISREKKKSKRKKKDKEGETQNAEMEDSTKKIIDLLMKKKKQSLEGDVFKKPLLEEGGHRSQKMKKQERESGTVIGKNMISLVSDDESRSIRSSTRTKKNKNKQDLIEKLFEEERQLHSPSETALSAQEDINSSKKKKKKKKKGVEEEFEDEVKEDDSLSTASEYHHYSDKGKKKHKRTKVVPEQHSTEDMESEVEVNFEKKKKKKEKLPIK